MKKTLVELWNGNLNPGEWRTDNSRRLGNLLDMLEENIKELSGGLNGEQKKLLKDIDDSYLESECISCEDAFVKGFSLGVRIMAEALIG
ncbi:MAG: hypothetical protein IJW99_04935 [Clostridia bacterium]|nr:hypothetical protein [Clostridia bacterium]